MDFKKFFTGHEEVHVNNIKKPEVVSTKGADFDIDDIDIDAILATIDDDPAVLDHLNGIDLDNNK